MIVFRSVLLKSRHFNQFTRKNSNHASDGFMKKLKENQIPIWAGLSIIGIFHYRRLRKSFDDQLAEALSRGELVKTEEPITPFKISLYNVLPLDSLSRFMGSLSRCQVPKWARKFLYGSYAQVYGVNLEEALEPDLTAYNCVNDFFRRRLKSGCRPIDANADLVAPCDGKILHCGIVDDENHIEQVKGMTYALEEFIGRSDIQLKPDHCLHQVIMYLAPGDYHCFHNPANWCIAQRRHFAGKLFSVKPSVATWMPKLFALNERVAYLGSWKNDQFFSFIAVGATNVGSIVIEMDPELETNCIGSSSGCCKSKEWKQAATVEKGGYFGEFNLGSTIVLIFEAPKDFQFNVKAGDKIKVGTKL